MTVEFLPAKRENVSLLIALAGSSGSGKTFSALRLAQGIAPEGKIAFIDTESRRGLHYSDRFKFLHYDMKPPFPPARFIEAIRAAEKAAVDVIIIDSFSLEHDGEGGLIDMADAAERAGTKSPGNWRVPKMEHKKLMNVVLQSRASVIFCLRADEKIRIEKNPDTGRTQIVPLGWTPITEKRVMYEMTASFTLTADRPGMPNYSLVHKLQEQHRSMFPENERIGEEAGRKLAAWARGDAPADPPIGGGDLAKAIADGDMAASFSTTGPLQAFWSGLTKEMKAALGAQRLADWKAQVAENAANETTDEGTDNAGH
jgi:hypothetical protein